MFDNVYAICFTGKPYRRDALMDELSRVGVEDVHTIWDFPSPFKPYLLAKIPHIPDLDSQPGTWGASLAHYRAIKTAYELGQDNVLVVEDDCRFLKDAGAVRKALEAAPADWDVLMLDHFNRKYPDGKPVNGWQRVGRAQSAACYIVNRRAMERLIDMYESPVSGKYRKPLMRICDHWTNARYLGQDIAIYCAVPNLAIQCDCGDAANCDLADGSHVQTRFYASDNLQIGNYAPYSSDGKHLPPPPPVVAEPVTVSAQAHTPVNSPLTQSPSTPVRQTDAPVDVLYVVGRGAKGYGDLPLHWSLRSLAKHAKNLGRVIVVGYPPDWLSDEVVKVYAEDKTGGKHWNILNCIAEGIRQAHIDGPFLYSSDDHYLCRDADLTMWPRYERGRLLSLQEYVENKKRVPGTYQRSLCDTRRCLAAERLSTRKACLHFNTWMDGRNLDEVLALADRHKSFTHFGFEPTCLFNAIFEKKNPGAKYEHKSNGDDRKVHTVADIDAKLKSGLLQFSTPPAAEQNAAIVAKMNSLFPEKCRFER